MANNLPNKITQPQAETAANTAYEKYTLLADVYDEIKTRADGGEFTHSVTIAFVDHHTFVKNELTDDGYTIIVEGNELKISWGEAPAT